MLRNFPRNVWAFICGWEKILQNSRQIPHQISRQKIKKEFTDELLQKRREKIYEFHAYPFDKSPSFLKISRTRTCFKMTQSFSGSCVSINFMSEGSGEAYRYLGMRYVAGKRLIILSGPMRNLRDASSFSGESVFVRQWSKRDEVLKKDLCTYDYLIQTCCPTKWQLSML